MIARIVARPSPRRGSTLAVASLLGTLLAACGGGGGGDGPSGTPTPPACTPSCAGKQCGPNGCGGSCGSCDDGNRCTSDTCSASGLCTHAAVSDFSTCQDLLEYDCTSGVPSTVDCRSACKTKGYNVAQSCWGAGTCSCGTTTVACNASQRFCDANTGWLDTCDPALALWTTENCTWYCASKGWSGSDGCRGAPFNVCTCLGSTPTGSCHGPNGDCSGSTPCCGGLSCTWQYINGAGRYSCLTPTTCEARCKEGSVCCGGAFCAGECIGNPCCN